MTAGASMPNTTDRVNEILQHEFALRVTLERGLMNRQALCRWLIKHYDLDASVDAIDKALREWDGIRTEGHLQAARQAFAHVKLSGNSPVSLLYVKRTEGVQKKIGSLFSMVDGEEEDDVRIVPGSREFLVALDRDHADEAVQLLGAENVRKPADNLRVLQIRLQGPTNPGAPTAALAISALAACDIDVPHVLTGSTEQFLLLNEGDVGTALQILGELKESIRGPDEQ